MTREEAIEIVKKHGILADGTKFESALRELIPELAESEDERIRKELMEFVNWAASRGSVRNDWLIKKCPEKWVAYLEKMKENPKSADSILSDCVSDVKWADTIITRVIVALSDDVDYNMDEPCKYRREINDLKKLREVLCGQKEQKPVDYEAELKKCKDNPLYFYDKYVSIKQKPAEWSEEDEKMLEATDESLYCYESGKAPEAVAQIETERCWLQSLPERFSLQPKPEWSVEDDKMFNVFLHKVEVCNLLTNKENVWIVKKLRSLRPQPSWKPSEVCYGPKGDPDPAGTSDLEEAAEEYVSKTLCDPNDGPSTGLAKGGFIAGAEWMRKKDVEDMYMSDNRHFLKCYEQGKFAMKLELMENSVDARITRILGSRDGSLELTVSGLDIPNDFFEGNKVKIIRG